MSEKLPSPEKALQLLKKAGCRENVIKHAEAVSALAVEIASTCKERGYNVDLNLVEIGGLLHDIGRAKTHSVHHAIAGAQIGETLGLPDSVVSIIKRHVGGGIGSREAKRLGWPKDLYIPQSLEEKIVCYADKLVEGARRVRIEKTIRNLSKKDLPPPAIERIWRLHEEMLAMVGDCECLP